MPIKAVIFDLDGTLYESRHLALRLIFGDLRHALILKEERKARHQIMGRFYEGGAEECYNALFDAIAARKGISREKVSRWFWNSYMPLQAKVLKKYYKPVEGLKTVMESYRAQGCKLAVLSDYGFVNQKLRALGIDPDGFDLLMEAPQLGGLKPCSETFLKACSLLGVEPKEALMIGDRDDTDGGAVQVGMQFRNCKREGLI